MSIMMIISLQNAKCEQLYKIKMSSFDEYASEMTKIINQN